MAIKCQAIKYKSIKLYGLELAGIEGICCTTGVKTIKAYLDLIKSKHGLPSDYALAKKLGVQSAQITNYRRGLTRPDDMMSVKIARLLDINPLEVIAVANYHRSDDPTVRKFWKRVYQETN